MLESKKVMWEVSEKTIVTKGGGAYIGTAKDEDQAKLMALAPLMWNLILESGDKEAVRRLQDAERAL